MSEINDEIMEEKAEIYENICKRCDRSITLKERWDKVNEDGTMSPYIKIHTYCGHSILSQHIVTSDDEYPIIECECFYEKKENKNG